jgi:hypothetical protein
LPRNSSGTYTAPSNSWNPAVAGTVIDADDWNTQLADYIDSFTDSLSRTGDGGMLADLEVDANAISLTEIASPSSPAANNAKLYALDQAGTTRLAYKDSAGTETILAAGGLSGSTGATDNAILRADGTGGSTLQNSPLQIADTTGVLTKTATGEQFISAGVVGTAGQTIVSGYQLTVYDYGSKAASSTITVDPRLSVHQKATLTTTGGAAVTVLAPSVEGDCILKILNGSGGTVTTPTFSGFDKLLTGDTFATGDTKINWIFIYNMDGLQAYLIKNMN